MQSFKSMASILNLQMELIPIVRLMIASQGRLHEGMPKNDSSLFPDMNKPNLNKTLLEMDTRFSPLANGRHHDALHPDNGIFALCASKLGTFIGLDALLLVRGRDAHDNAHVSS